jgi:outer membrane protein OmpA-like peptidoglycan-associated protein
VPSQGQDANSAVNLVAHRMRQHFEDQLVAGVSRPSVELEVHFDFDSEEIHSESGPQIEAAAEVLNKHFPAARFRVAGFTDAAGPEKYNQQLSERRAIAVWQVLVEEYGVKADRLERVGFGEEDPSLDATDAQRRRVELQILRNEGDEAGAGMNARML